MSITTGAPDDFLISLHYAVALLATFRRTQFRLETKRKNNAPTRTGTKQGCLDDARALLDAYNDDDSACSSNLNSKNNADNKNNIHKRHPCGSTGRGSGSSSASPMSSIHLAEGDFLEEDGGNPSIVCTSSACFDEELMVDITKWCHGLLSRQHNVRVVVTLDRPLPNVVSELENNENDAGDVSRAGVGGQFEVKWQCQVEGCWGGAAVAYVHERVSRNLAG